MNAQGNRPRRGFALLAALLAASTLARAQLRPSQPEPPSGWTREAARAREALHGGGRQPARGRGGRAHARARRQRDRRDGRHAARAEPGRAAAPRASAAAPSCSTTTRRRRRSAPTTGARWRPRAPRRRSSSAPTASRWRSSPRASAAARWACPARRACSRSRTCATASLPGRRSSRPPSSSPRRASRSRRASTRSWRSDKGLADEPAARAYFFDAEGQPKAVGTIIRNPEFAATLRAIAARGADAFYEGDIARDIVAAVRGHRNPGTLSLEDLAGYRVRDVEALCGPYRAWKLCGMPPSSSGGIAVLQILGMLARFDMAARAPRLRRRPCTWSPRPSASPSPTATSTSPTTASSTCRWRACSIPPTSRSARS